MTLHDAADLFRFSLDPLELVLRGSAVYWFLFLLFRFVMRRDAGSIGIADVLLLVLIADASQNAMAGEYTTVADGFVLVATIAGWDRLIDWAGYRFNALRRLVEPLPLVLVRRGRLQRRTMQSQFLTESELMGRLRQQGVEKLAEVKIARMESDGEISVIRTSRADDDNENRPQPTSPSGPPAG